MKRFIIAFSLLMLVGAGCPLMPRTQTPPVTLPETPSEDISVSIDGAWELKTFTASGEASQDVSEIGATLTIEGDARLAAKICNSMSGTYDIQSGELKVGALMSTKMFCAGPAGEIEAAFSQGLSTGMAYEHDGNALVLRSDTGAVFTYARAADGRIGTPSDEEPGEDRTYAGIVTSIDLEHIAVDGPAAIVIRTAAGAEEKILVPSFGLGLCKAKASIADVYELKVGDTVEARGSVGEDGAIIPCQSEAHYLRVIKK